ncbi:LppA family lipoprotein [Haloechinothrix sp. LS1_15]|uniref:LppA family lipoprotein n=1 Tax=Haloechinothrix sp. LS1_15 TaxID=2652248 RepID=UPI00294B6B89|nr:LppA family lipoprotein [Haloechinothrix sp. LS1_15]
MSLEEQYETVAERPDRKQAIAAYEELQEKVRAALRERFDFPEWEPGGGEERTTPGCSEFPDLIGLDAASTGLQNWIAEAGISPYDWSDAQDILREAGREYGFEQVTLDIQESHDLSFELTNDTGAKLRLMSGRNTNTVLRVSTGCHLEPAAKERGRPISQEEWREMPEDERDRHRD